MRTVEMPLEGGGCVLFEVDEAVSDKTYRGAGELGARATESFESAIGQIKPMADALAAQLSNLARAPESVVVEFGIKVTANAGAVIAKAGGEASLKVTLSWKKSG
ncbi:CU044_2847 family protein [Niveibacterium sp. SC-1]|uniref:CU044_2847 family protein n=1 Tax=Niveibacterium sp. SC-1 TaxID=3135646 RepID=UPI00311ECCA8